MSVTDLLVAAFMAGGAVLRASQLPRAWPDPRQWQTPPEGLWPALFGRAVARGADRALLAQTIILASAALVMASLTAATALRGSLAARYGRLAASPADSGS